MKTSINRALSYMNLEETLEEDEAQEANPPPSKKPRLADSIGDLLKDQERIVPQQSVTLHKFGPIVWCVRFYG